MKIYKIIAMSAAAVMMTVGLTACTTFENFKEAFFDSNACCKVLEKIYLKPSKEEKEWS